MNNLPDNLRAARRHIDGFPELSLARDLRSVGNGELWAFAIDVTIVVPEQSLVPRTTRWWIVLSSQYPWGFLEAFPDAANGITVTFPHQNCNLPPSQDCLNRRQGNICVRTPNWVFKQRHLNREPIGNSHRMKWFLNQMLGWIEAAANRTLVSNGDPFELPRFCENSQTVVWSESDESWKIWASTDVKYGLAEVCHISGENEQDSIVAVRYFKDVRGNEILRTAWGNLISDKPETTTAVWIRLPGVPFIEPYQAPLTWGELRDVFRTMRIPFDGWMRRVLQPIRDGRDHLGLIGFPIPKRFGDDAELMHWQAMKLPPLAYGIITQPGFRPNTRGYWQRDCFESFRRSDSLKWCKSRNWHKKQLGGRGMLETKAVNKYVAMVGAGAVGSVLSELLVRAGIERITIIDHDTLEGGNLVRHTLALDDVGTNKAVALTERLKGLSPHAKVTAVPETFPPLSITSRKLVLQRDISSRK